MLEWPCPGRTLECGDLVERAKTNRLVPAFVMAMAILACGCESLGLEEGEVRVRIENRSAEVFDEVTLFLPKLSLPSSDLHPGTVTPYVTVTNAYHIASAQSESLTMELESS